MAESRLPAGAHQDPRCGACEGETYHDGDVFVCDDCQLAFEGADLEAAFLDSTAETCGKPCENWWHGRDRIKAGYEYDCGTCQLPIGHRSMCWTGCQPRKAS